MSTPHSSPHFVPDFTYSRVLSQPIVHDELLSLTQSIREQHQREDTSLKDKLQYKEQAMQALRRKCA